METAGISSLPLNAASNEILTLTTNSPPLQASWKDEGDVNIGKSLFPRM